MGKYINWEGVNRDLNSPEFKKRFYRDSLLIGLACGLLSFGMASLGNYVKTHDIVSKNQIARQVKIDRDELSDLVIGDKIFLAEKTDDWIVYRPLRSSDIYRIK